MTGEVTKGAREGAEAGLKLQQDTQTFQMQLEEMLKTRRQKEESDSFARGQEAAARSSIYAAADKAASRTTRRGSNPVAPMGTPNISATDLGGVPYGPVSGATTLLGFK